MNTPPNRRLVIARDYADFKKYVDHEANPQMMHVYVADANVLAGRSFTGDQLVYLGGWEHHREAEKIQARVRFQLNRNAA